MGYGPWKHLPSRVGYTSSSAMLSYAGTATLAMEATQANIGDNSVFTGTFDYYTKTVNVLPAVSTANTVIYDQTAARWALACGLMPGLPAKSVLICPYLRRAKSWAAASRNANAPLM